jgi:hypothetical protein
MRREAEDDTAAMAGLSEARVRFTRVAESMKTQATTAEGLTGNLGKALSGETDAILRDLRQVRGLRPSKEGEAAIRRRLGVLASRMVVRGAMSEHRIRLAKLGHDVDAAVRDLAVAAFNSPGDWPAIMEETEAKLARFKDKLPPDILAAKVAAARETIAQNTVAGLIELDPALAIRGLKEGAFDDDLPGRPGATDAPRPNEAKTATGPRPAPTACAGWWSSKAPSDGVRRANRPSPKPQISSTSQPAPGCAKSLTPGAPRTRRGTGASRRSRRCSPGAPRPPAKARGT